MSFEFETESIHTCDYYDFDELVRKEYPALSNYEFVADHCCQNDTCYKFNVSVVDDDNYDDKHLRESMEKGYGSWLATDLLQDLVQRSVIPSGCWVIQVSW